MPAALEEGGAPRPWRTYGFLHVHPQAHQVVAEERDPVLGAMGQGEVGAAGPRLKAHKAAGDEAAAQLHGPRLDGDRHGLLLTQVNLVGYIWNHTHKTGVSGHPVKWAKIHTKPLMPGECGKRFLLFRQHHS